MIPLASELQRRGNEVIFGADKNIIPLLGSELPGISITEIRGMRIRYSRFLPQYMCILLQLPRIIASSVREHYDLRRLALHLQPDLIISDSRFGFRHRKIVSVYVTHQLRIAFPTWLRMMEPLGERLHRMIISRFDLCLVPDYPGPANLSGRLSHDLLLPKKIIYTGPLSRFGTVTPGATTDASTSASANAAASSTSSVFAAANIAAAANISAADDINIPSASARTFAAVADSPTASTVTSASPVTSASTAARENPPLQPFCCLILSGPEPQRTILLKKVIAWVTEMPLVILSTPPLHPERTGDQKITVVANPDTATMRRYLLEASRIISRAGYTTIMELASLGRGAILIPTPGQTEQEYLGRYLNGHRGFVTVSQRDLRPGSSLRHSSIAGARRGISHIASDIAEGLSDAAPLGNNTEHAGEELPYSTPPGNITPHDEPKLPDAAPLLEKALDMLLEKEEQ